MKVRGEKIKALRFEAELRIGDSTFADQNHLLAATHCGNRGGPFFQRGVIGKLVHGPGRKVTELTGPSQIVTPRTIAFSPATASASPRWNHCAMFSADGLTESNGGTSLMHP